MCVPADRQAQAVEKASRAIADYFDMQELGSLQDVLNELYTAGFNDCAESAMQAAEEAFREQGATRANAVCAGTSGQGDGGTVSPGPTTGGTGSVGYPNVLPTRADPRPRPEDGYGTDGR